MASRFLTGNTGTRLDEIPEYGYGWSGSKSKQTLGILDVPGQGNVYLESGVHPPLDFPLGNGHTFVNRGHVEVHSVRIMTLEGIDNATLYINHPTGPCPGGGGCSQNLEKILPTGYTLNVHWPNNGYHSFVGQ